MALKTVSVEYIAYVKGLLLAIQSFVTMSI